MKKIVAIIQARMGSTRLPGKVLRDIGGEPMLVRDVHRVMQSTMIHTVVVATSNGHSDDPIIALCKEHGWDSFRGDELDVLDRFYQCAKLYKADIIVRITADCPLIDADVIDRVIQDFVYHLPGIDYASNVLPIRTFPRGLDTEVISFKALERSWLEDTNSKWREHVTQYIHHHPNWFTIHCVENDPDLSSFRWTVDTREDLEFVKKIYEYFTDDRFSWKEILTVLKAHPELLEINLNVPQKVI